MSDWSATITNNPVRNNALEVELEQGDQIRARLYRDDLGQLQLRIDEGKPPTIPVDWLVQIVARFQEDLAANDAYRKSEGITTDPCLRPAAPREEA